MKRSATLASISAIVLCGSSWAAALAAGPTASEQPIPEDASTAEITQMLRETRGLQLKGSSKTTTGDSYSSGSQDSSTVSAASISSVSMPVYFALDSDELTPAAIARLDRLGAALSSPEFSGDRWLIEGHTDASGDNQHNRELSERRAASVYNYLISKHGLDPNALETVGRGEEELYEPSDPYSGANRRVRIQPLGDS